MKGKMIEINSCGVKGGQLLIGQNISFLFSLLGEEFQLSCKCLLTFSPLFPFVMPQKNEDEEMRKIFYLFFFFSSPSFVQLHFFHYSFIHLFVKGDTNIKAIIIKNNTGRKSR